MIVLTECLTTSNTLNPVLSTAPPSPGIGASDPMDPDISITQQISIGARVAGVVGAEGGVSVMSSLLDLWSAESDIATGESEASTAVHSESDTIEGVMGSQVWEGV